jgi:hypothetical protein
VSGAAASSAIRKVLLSAIGSSRSDTGATLLLMKHHNIRLLDREMIEETLLVVIDVSSYDKSSWMLGKASLFTSTE